MSIAQQFGANLRRYRRWADLSQEETAARASIHRTAVGMIERGERMPRVDTIAKLAAVLDIEPGRLFEGIVWESGTVRLGHFAETEVPGFGTVQRKIKVERPADSQEPS
jgi:transcriptional regulator with XRE-family HTH domain